MRNFLTRFKKLKALKTLKTLPLILAASCSLAPKKTGEPLKSLCILDFEEKKCWISRPKRIYRDFKDMNECHFGGECFFGIEENDLKRIQDALNK